ncbi:hypothetical protein PUH89_12125 [Rhodobacter capsulatus]|jgi:hypothetical protein|uniref:hypothetical protein n=1 Tax=Rhodobacterales TaxID=204455 RepID=UPI001113A73A|nr:MULTISPECIES: hypothetical protein [Paracoccaceae]WER08080.1 hypothetical protein PUH89_12125 [Rhodobacter capsulatus]
MDALDDGRGQELHVPLQMVKSGICFTSTIFLVGCLAYELETKMGKNKKSTPPDDDLEALQQYIVQLEGALADYAQRFGLTDKARAALSFHSTHREPRR